MQRFIRTQSRLHGVVVLSTRRNSHTARKVGTAHSVPRRRSAREKKPYPSPRGQSGLSPFFAPSTHPLLATLELICPKQPTTTSTSSSASTICAGRKNS